MSGPDFQAWSREVAALTETALAELLPPSRTAPARLHDAMRGRRRPWWFTGESKRLRGLLAEFEDPETLRAACERVRDAGFTRWDAHTPFPVHGLEGAMGLRRSPLPWIVLVMGLLGAALGFALQWWVHAVAYPLVISGKPYFSWPAFIPITFELGILFAALGAVFGMFGLNRLPMHYHPLFRSKVFDRVTDDAFFISIESWDPRFDPSATGKLLESLGARSVEIVGS